MTQATKLEDLVISEDYVSSLDALIDAATGGKFAAVEDIKKIAEKEILLLKKQVDSTKKQLSKVKAELKKQESEPKRFAPSIEKEPLGSKDSSRIPEGTFSTALASDVFLGSNGEKHEFLNFEVPVFDWDSPHPEVPEIDDSYVFRSDMLVTFLYGLVTNQNTWLHGHTGTGKTTFVEQVAARLQWPVVRVNLDNDIERSDFLGQTQLVTSEQGTTESKFVEGVLPRAMQTPSIFLVDEMDFGKSGIMYVMQRALEAKGLLLTEDGGRLISPHPLFRIAATANTRGQGDEDGCYPGARTQSNALLDRFTVWIHVDYMDKEQEKKLLKAHFPDISDSYIDSLTQFAREVRKAFSQRELLQSISPRALLAICKAKEFIGAVGSEEQANQVAINSAYLQKATADTVTKVKELYQRAF